MNQASITTSITTPTNTEQKQTIETFKISLQVVGIKNRCRKSDRHLFQLGFMAYNNGEFNKDEVITLARNFIQSNMRQVNSIVRIYLDHVIKITEDGYTCTQWEPFSDKNIRIDISV